MGLFTLLRFLTPNNGVSVSELSADLSTTAALGLAVENLDTYATRNNGSNAGTSAFTLDASLASDTAGLKLPSKAGAAPTADGFLAFDTTAHRPVVGENGSTLALATITGTETLTNKTLTAPTLSGPKVDLIKDTSGNTVETITAAGGVQIGSPTGGDKGSGTLNAAGLYVNGTAVSISSSLTVLGPTFAASNTTMTSSSTFYTAVTLGSALPSGGKVLLAGCVSVAVTSNDSLIWQMYDSTNSVVITSEVCRIPNGEVTSLTIPGVTYSGYSGTPTIIIRIEDITTGGSVIEKDDGHTTTNKATWVGGVQVA